jgi:hypothetical protein
MKGDPRILMSLPSPLDKPFFFLEHPSSFWRVGFLLASWEWPVSLENGKDGLTWD